MEGAGKFEWADGDELAGQWCKRPEGGPIPQEMVDMKRFALGGGPSLHKLCAAALSLEHWLDALPPPATACMRMARACTRTHMHAYACMRTRTRRARARVHARTCVHSTCTARAQHATRATGETADSARLAPSQGKRHGHAAASSRCHRQRRSSVGRRRPPHGRVARRGRAAQGRGEAACVPARVGLRLEPRRALSPPVRAGRARPPRVGGAWARAALTALLPAGGRWLRGQSHAQPLAGRAEPEGEDARARESRALSGARSTASTSRGVSVTVIRQPRP